MIKSEDKETKSSTSSDKEVKTSDVSNLPALKEVDVYFLNQKNISKSIEIEEENLGAFDEVEKLIDNFLITRGSDVERLFIKEKKYDTKNTKEGPFGYLTKYKSQQFDIDWYYSMKINNIETMHNKLSNDYEYLLSIEDRVNNIVKINDKTANRLIPKCEKIVKLFTDIADTYDELTVNIDRKRHSDVKRKNNNIVSILDSLIMKFDFLKDNFMTRVKWITDQFKNLLRYKSVLARYFYSMVVKRAA